MNTTNGADPGEIITTTDAGGVTLSWPAYKADARSSELASAPFVFLWLCCWTAGGGLAIWSLVSGRGHPLTVLWLFGWAAGEVFVAWHLLTVIRSVLPEHIRLEPARLSYYPGRGPSSGRSCAELPGGRITPVSPAPAADVAKSTIRGFGIDRVHERQRLFVDANDRRFEIGGCLTESERAWLFAVLEQWLGRSAPPRWSRKALTNKEEAQS